MFEKITAAFLAARLWLDTAGGAGTAFGVLIAAVFLLMYGFRKWPFTARIWERVASVIPALNFDMTPGLVILSKVWQGFFPTITATVFGALASGGSVKVALLASLAGPLTVLGHEFAKWLPVIPYRGAISAKAVKAKPAPKRSDSDDDGDDGDGGLSGDDTTPPTPRRPFVASAYAATLLLACLLQGCASGLTPKTIDQAAIILCDTFFREHPKVGVSPKEVEQALCSTADQLEPFLKSAKSASERAGAVRLGRSEDAK